ncbi:MAG TPA: phytoene/squalene synthase family protein, partial [Acidobacteriota bacterium]|nr:phytoene/squalene synthase family protein [Acidobacteriota bacterium]
MKSAFADRDELLKNVSRSFYLTLRVLPRSIKSQLSLAYLLARATDTVADTRLVDFRRRLDVLVEMRKCIQEACGGRFLPTPDLKSFACNDGKPEAEQILLSRFDVLLEGLKEFGPDDCCLIRNVLDFITRGQERDLILFGAASEDQIVALRTDEELDCYTYDVAGCVGEFWTKLCRAHVFPSAGIDDGRLLADAVLFGKGLQLVNILRDLPGDLEQGRCYIPERRLGKYGLKPSDLLDTRFMLRFRPLYDRYLDQAAEHLRAGWRYTKSLPFRHVRVRLACAWPVLIGLETLARLRDGNILDRSRRVKLFRP